MPYKKYRITLTESERAAARGVADSNTQTKTLRTRAQALLMADEGSGGPGFIDEDIASALGCAVGTVERVRRRCSEEGVAATLERKKCARRPHKRKLDGRGEATLVATACSRAPEGAASWSLRLLAGRLVELGVSDEISHETVRRTLKKTSSNRG
jgi:transposase